MSFKSILHPTDFSDQSKVAFYHALKLALIEKSKLIVMYAMHEDKDPLDWDKFPKIRDTLHKWDLIDKDASRNDIYKKLGIKIKKIIGKGENIIESVSGIVYEEEVDLIVLATHGREGLPRWLHSSISESISRQALVPTLFVPYNSKPFVSENNGEINLKEILVPIDYNPAPQRAIEFGVKFGKIYGKNNVRINIMHVIENINGETTNDMPKVDIPENENCIIRLENKHKSIEEEIIRVAKEISADLVVIPTEGRTGFVDVIFGSTSEQLLKKSTCPILTIPVAHGDYLIRE
ncbi:MAG: universal stress protein [Candidatus Dadabacteria bacterium]|nr:universal stress protein [Candidatus Dadabacteria bacterium]NIQ16633.1 universal stress protein [Candidatus Dadabacteria bacterium]